MNGWLVVAGAVGAGVGALAAALAVWLAGRRPPKPQSAPGTATSARMARDIGVLSELLAERLAKVWLADGGPSAGSTEPDAIYHHVLESTSTIMRSAGASSKAALAVAALTAKKVRPGPIQQREPRS